MRSLALAGALGDQEQSRVGSDSVAFSLGRVDLDVLAGARGPPGAGRLLCGEVCWEAGGSGGIDQRRPGAGYQSHRWASWMRDRSQRWATIRSGWVPFGQIFSTYYLIFSTYYLKRISRSVVLFVVLFSVRSARTHANGPSPMNHQPHTPLPHRSPSAASAADLHAPPPLHHLHLSVSLAQILNHESTSGTYDSTFHSPRSGRGQRKGGSLPSGVDALVQPTTPSVVRLMDKCSDMGEKDDVIGAMTTVLNRGHGSEIRLLANGDFRHPKMDDDFITQTPSPKAS